MKYAWVASIVLFVALTACTKRTARAPEDQVIGKRGPRLGFRLSDADPEQPAARTAVRGEPLSAEQTAQLLARLPAPLASGDELEKPFALRPSTAPPPAPGRVLAQAFPPPTTAPAPTVTAGDVTVTRHAPDGEVSHAPTVSVSFSQPMVELTTVAALAAKAPPITLTPKPEGEFRWLGTQTLTFQPTTEFPKSTEYVVEIPAGTASVSGNKTAQAERFTFTTPTLHVVSSLPSPGTSTELWPLVLVEFDQRIDTQKLLARVEVEVTPPEPGAPRTRPVRLATSSEIDAQPGLRARIEAIERKGKDRILVLRTKTPLLPDHGVSVTFPAGTPSLEGPRLTPELLSFGFRTYEPLTSQEVTCDSCTPSSSIDLRFDNPLDAAAFDKSQVRVEPPPEGLRAAVYDSSILLSAHWKSGVHYTATLDHSIRDAYGQTLGSDIGRGFSVQPFAPMLLPMQPMSVVDPAQLAHGPNGGNPAYSIFSTNLGPSRVRVLQVTPDQWGSYQGFRHRYEMAIYEQKWKALPTPPGRVVIERELGGEGPVDDILETQIDLAQALHGDVGHLIVMVEPKVWDPDRRDAQHGMEWVQVTRIGMTSFEAASGGLSLLATGLERAEPLAGVTFSIPGTGLAATTDGAGLARIAGPLPSFESGASLVARRGDDAAFTPNLYGRQQVPDALRVFTFDDRGLYKPGETVRIKGIVRSVGAERGGDVSWPRTLAGQGVRWSVHDAQYTEIARGTAPLDDAGGLLVTFALKSEVNLGTANVSFEGLGDRLYGSATFQIQEFRRPEYEVGASVDAGAHVVGDFAVATATASYYSGGGLRAAQTDWTVTRQPAQFTPPNRSDYRFGKNESYAWYAPSVERGSAEQAAVTTGSWKGRTDVSGAHRLRVDLEGTGEPYPMTLSLVAQVRDANDQSWSTSTSMLVHPAHIYAGLKTERGFVQAGQPIVLDVIAADVEGALVPGRHVHLRSHRVVSEQIKGVWTPRDVDVTECDFVSRDTAAPKACSLGTGGSGAYYVSADVQDEQGNVSRTTLTMWALGSDVVGDRTLRPGALDLTLDKDHYAAGDHAELLVQAPFAPAVAVLEIIGGAAPRERHLTLTSRTQTLDIPIAATDEPGLSVRLTLVGSEPRQGEDGQVDPSLPLRPAFASKDIVIDVPPVDRELHVELKPAQRAVRPGDTDVVSLDITAAGPAIRPFEATVYVVDESVLALAGYTVRDPKSVLYTRAGTVSTVRELRSYVGLARSDRLHRLFVPAGAGRDRTYGMWGNGIGDSFGSGGLGLSGTGYGGGGRGEGIGLGNIGTLGHGAVARVARPAASVAPPEPRKEADVRDPLARNAKPTMLPTTPTATAAPQPGSAIALRHDFEALAFYAARVTTDSNGHAEVSVKLPDSTSRFRVMAVAWDQQHSFGTGESTITVRQPITLRPSAPRFLSYGDHVELPVIVQNQSEQPLTVALAARATNAVLDDAVGRSFSVAAGDRVELRIPAGAAQPGQAHFDFAVAASEPGHAEYTDAAHVELPVWTPGTTEAFATYGTLGDTHDEVVGQAVQLPDGIDRNFGGLDVSTSSTALFALSDAVLNLRRYPYESNEELASRILAVTTLRDTMRAFAGAEVASPAALATSVARDLQLLSGRQDASGGFGFWAHDAWPYLSAHVGFALATAKAKGYPVDAGMLDRTRQYLARIDDYIPAYYGADARRALQAYALFDLRLLGSPDPVKAARLVAEHGVQDTEIETLAWLVPTLAADPAQRALASEIARHFENRAVETAGAAHFTTSYGESDYLLLRSDHRTDALVLSALLETDPQNPLIPKVVAGLLGSRVQGHWQNTQDDAFVLLALDAYFHRYEQVTPSFVGRVWLGDRTASEHAFRGRNVDRIEAEVPMADLGALGPSTLTVQKQGAGRLYYRVGLRYAPSDRQLPAIDRGFAVARRYEATGDPSEVTRDAAGTWHVKAGAVVRVHVDFVATSERHHVALVDPMPAGFEALNTALQGTAPVPAPSNDKPTRRDAYAWYDHENLRDERAEAFTSLLWAGAHEYVYTARATTQGRFVASPAKAEEMYAPETFGRSASDQVVVE